MQSLPDKQQQIVQVHGELIRRVVHACLDPEQRAPLETVLKQSEANGWAELVGTIRAILDGRRDMQLLNRLDAEDRSIIEAILRGLQNPDSLSQTQLQSEPDLAAPGLAGMIRAAGAGDVNALALLASMAEQMVAVDGGMAKIGGLIRRMVNGERDPESLCAGLEPSGEKLVLSILTHLAQEHAH